MNADRRRRRPDAGEGSRPNRRASAAEDPLIPTAHLRRTASAQFSICPIRIQPWNSVSSSLIAHYSSLGNLPYPASPAIPHAIRRAARQAVRKITPPAIRRGILRAAWPALRSAIPRAIRRGTQRAARKAAGRATGRTLPQIAQRVAGQVARKAISRPAGQGIRSAIRRAVRQAARSVV